MGAYSGVGAWGRGGLFVKMGFGQGTYSGGGVFGSGDLSIIYGMSEKLFKKMDLIIVQLIISSSNLKEKNFVRFRE